MIKKLYFAPIKGITDKTFRNVFSSCFSGIDTAITPFITARDSEKKLKDVLPSSLDKCKLIPQILTKSDSQFIFLAKKMADQGCDEINWNLGCPFRKVIDKGEGAALLQSPELIDRFLDKVCSSQLPALSVKMRLGLHNSNEIFPVLERMNKYPLKEITIHPRTADQMYDGNINIAAFNEALKISCHKIIYNGDIKHFRDCDIIKTVTGELHGWMIGRGLLLNPFLAEEIHSGKTINAVEKIPRIKNFIDLLFHEYQSDLKSPAHVLDKMRGVWSYLSQSFENSKKIEKKIRKALNLNHYSDEIDRLFNSDLKINEIESSII